MKIKVCVSGVTGWVGSVLAREILNSNGLELVGAVSPSNAGKKLNDVIDCPETDVVISGSITEAVASRPDVMIDFTTPEAVKDNVITAVSADVNVVIGTSGLTDEDYNQIDILANKHEVGVLAAGNFALTAVLLRKFSIMAAKYLPQWEILDYSGASKPDAPSGTARDLAFSMSQVKKPEIVHPVDQTIGAKESRGATLNGVQVHSLRIPWYTLAAEVIFGMPDEKLIIKHEAGSSPDPYVAGTLLAVRNVQKFTGLKRGLDSIMEF